MVNTRSERLRTTRLSFMRGAVPRGAGNDRGTSPDAGLGIGSNDAAAALGLDPRKSRTRLWMEKTGRQALLQPATARDDVDPTADHDAAGDALGGGPAYWNRLLEQILAAHYMHRTGRSMRQIQAVQRHPQHAFMFAQSHREIVGIADPLLLECLSVGPSEALAWTDGVPAHVRVKIVHQLAVTGAGAADVLVLIAGQELQLHRVVRNEAEIAWLVAQEAAFWRQVELDQAPPAQSGEGCQSELWPGHCGVAAASPECPVPSPMNVSAPP